MNQYILQLMINNLVQLSLISDTKAYFVSLLLLYLTVVEYISSVVRNKVILQTPVMGSLLS